MEKMIPVIITFFIIGMIGLVCGLGLLHYAINDGNIWQGIVAGICIIISGSIVLRTAPIFFLH